MRCGPCTRERFCRRCAKERAARSTKKSGKKYQRSKKGRVRHRARSLAYYHRRGKELRRQRHAHEAAVQEPEEAPADESEYAHFAPGPSPAELGVSPEMPCDSDKFDAVRLGCCLTQKRVGEGASRQVTMESLRASPAVHTPGSHSEEEVVDAKAPPGRSRRASMSVLTTVAQVRAALQNARESGFDDVVVWGRCARCGRVGRVVHFDGVLRTRARAP